MRWRFAALCLIGLFLATPISAFEDRTGLFNPLHTVTAGDNSVVRVQYLDGSPRSNADVLVRYPARYIGSTNESGLVGCSLPDGDYVIYAVYSLSQFGTDVYLGVPGTATITANYEITPPVVNILSPQNQTYDGRLVPLNFSVYDYSPISWMGYSLDGQANTTVTGNITMNVDRGSHNVVVFANDTYGNMGFSDEVYFSSLGGCVVIRVQYKDGYPRSNADVYVFDPLPIRPLGTSNESGLVTKCGYLAPGDYLVRADYPVGGPQFGGNRDLHVDSNGDGSGTITNWNLEITPPAIEILSPQNLTYFNSSVPLNFTVYDYSPISWMGYSLDGEANVTASGNITLTLADRPHQVVVYANDTFGNMGVSNEVLFERAIIVPDDYPSIQDAINAASTGDTVYVRNGTYHENVIVNKTLSLVGEDAENTIIDGGGVGSALTIVADHVNVTGFTMRNSNYGISLDGANYCNITENSITANNGRGVWLDSSSSNSVSGNDITNNGDGIYLSSSSNNSMSGNNITNNVYHGIWLAYSSLNNSVSGNSITDNQYGIVLSSSSNNNSISGNNVTANNRLGIDLHSSSSNRIFHNNFVNNNIQVYSSGSPNAWDDGYPSGGNFWSDYNGADSCHGPSQNVFGSDGIGDQPYVIDAQNQDNYPFMTVGGSLTMGSSAGGGKYSVC